MSRLLRGHLGRPVPSLRDVMRLSLPPAVWMAAMQPTGGSSRSGAAILAGAETNALALDFTDMSAVVRDTGTPANNFTGDPNSLLTYSSPSAKWVRLRSGLWASGTTLRTHYDESGNALGIVTERSRTSLAIRPRELGNATYWTVSNITPSTVAGVDGVAGAASRITATAGNATVLGSSNTSSSQSRRLAPFVRRVSGTGALQWTLDGGSTWTSFTGITSSWQRIGVGATVTNPRVGFRIVDSGDSFDIDFANGETGAFDTSPLHVDGATGVITRARDQITIDVADFPVSPSTVTLYVRAQPYSGNTAPGFESVMTLTDNTADNRATIGFLNSKPQIEMSAGGSGTVNTGGSFANWTTMQAAAFAYASNDANAAFAGTAGTDDTSVTPVSTYTVLKIGSESNHAQRDFHGYISEAVFLPRRRSNVELATVTA